MTDGPMDERTRRLRLLDAAENIAAELERLRLLKEHELSARVVYDQGNLYVKPDEVERP